MDSFLSEFDDMDKMFESMLRPFVVINLDYPADIYEDKTTYC